MGLSKDHPAYQKHLLACREYGRRTAEKRRVSKPINREGYFAPVDCKGRWLDVEGVWIMTYQELCSNAKQGYLSSGTLLEQADMRGNSLGMYRLDIKDGKPILRKELT